jgi:threonine aldolase
MRQSGVLAATGIYALNNMVNRLSEDHHHARMIASGESDMRFTHDGSDFSIPLPLISRECMQE